MKSSRHGSSGWLLKLMPARNESSRCQVPAITHPSKAPLSPTSITRWIGLCHDKRNHASRREMVGRDSFEPKMCAARQSLALPRRLLHQLRNHALHSADDQRKAVVVEFVRRIGLFVVMRIAKRSRVR